MSRFEANRGLRLSSDRPITKSAQQQFRKPEFETTLPAQIFTTWVCHFKLLPLAFWFYCLEGSGLCPPEHSRISNNGAKFLKARPAQRRAERTFALVGSVKFRRLSHPWPTFGKACGDPWCPSAFKGRRIDWRVFAQTFFGVLVGLQVSSYPTGDTRWNIQRPVCRCGKSKPPRYSILRYF